MKMNISFYNIINVDNGSPDCLELILQLSQYQLHEFPFYTDLHFKVKVDIDLLIKLLSQFLLTPNIEQEFTTIF